MQTIQTILHPTDFSDCARRAFDTACSRAKTHGSRLVLAHVVDVEYGKRTFGGVKVKVRPPDHPEQMLRKLENMKPTVPGLEVEHVVGEGHPVEEILQLAKDTPADLIVMGTHGLTGLKRLLMGSVAEQVVRQALCPVETVTPEAGSSNFPAEG